MIAMLKEYLSTIVVLAAALGVITGALAYFAKASELQEVKEEVVMTQLRLEQKVVSDQLFDLQKRAWALEERNRLHGECLKWPDERDRDEYRMIQMQLEGLKVKQNKMMEQKAK